MMKPPKNKLFIFSKQFLKLGIVLIGGMIGACSTIADFAELSPPEKPVESVSSKSPMIASSPSPPTPKPTLTPISPEKNEIDISTEKIVFVSERDANPLSKSKGSEIYIMNVDGSHQSFLTETVPYRSVDPDLSPDRKKIVFSSNIGGNEQILVMDFDGNNMEEVTRVPSYYGDTSPVWSPDQSKIAFVTSRYTEVDLEISIMNVDGSNLINISQTPKDARFTYRNQRPSWSPDGKQIVFVSKRDREENIIRSEYDEIYIMNADGSNQTRLTHNSIKDSDPSWSPDGSKIAFTSNRDGNNEIYVMNIDVSNTIINPDRNPINLTNNPSSDDREPDWSPDGTQIAFVSNRDGNMEIYIMNADGGNLQRLTNNSADDYSPSWR